MEKEKMKIIHSEILHSWVAVVNNVLKELDGLEAVKKNIDDFDYIKNELEMLADEIEAKAETQAERELSE
jgi:hypothetical protein